MVKRIRTRGLFAGSTLLAGVSIWAAVAAAPVPPIRFREVAAAAGVSFVLENHPTERKHMIETMPGGIAVFDYDGDGRPDIYFTNGADIPSLEKTAPNTGTGCITTRATEVPGCDGEA